jgi:hypothetical protein
MRAPPMKGQKQKIRTITVKDMPLEAVIVAYYNTFTKKEGSQKVRKNVIIGIKATEVDGERIPEDKQVWSSCSREFQYEYRAH